jgi:zinc protease
MKRTACLLLAWLAGASAGAVEVAFEHDPGLPMVHLEVVLKAGAVNDPRAQSGLTNFMGEMLLRGTRNRTKEQIDLALDQMGARLEVETKAEYLRLKGSVLSAQLDPFLALLADLVTQSTFPEREVGKLKAELSSGILDELGNDQTLVGRAFPRALFRDHPYGNPITGRAHEVKSLTSKAVRDQYDRLVVDPLLLVVGSGDAPPARIEAWARELGRARPAADPKALPAPVALPRNAPMRRLLIADKPERTQTQIAAGQVGVRMTDADFFPLFLANHAFGGGSFSARLMVEIRVKRGWSYGANSYFRHGTRPRSWQFSLFPAAKYTPEALAEALRMVAELREKGITAEEFEFAKRSLVNSAGFMFDTPEKRVDNKVLERTLGLPDGLMSRYAEKLAPVTLEEANTALKRFLAPGQLAVAVVGTASELREPLAKAVGVPANQVEVAPYTDF